MPRPVPRTLHYSQLDSFPGSLVDDEGNSAGTIRLNTSRADWLSLGLSHVLIVLSLAKAVNSHDYLGILDEWEIPEGSRDLEFYEFSYFM